MYEVVLSAQIERLHPKFDQIIFFIIISKKVNYVDVLLCYVKYNTIRILYIPIYIF